MRRLLLLLTATACGPVREPTPGGLVIFNNRGEPSLSEAKERELDARHAAVLECLPPEVFCTREPPTFAIEGNCDTFWDPFIKRPIRGYTQPNGNRRIVLPGSLGAAAHEISHYYSCDAGHGPDSWPRKCGDVIDGQFRRLYPPQKCETDP